VMWPVRMRPRYPQGDSMNKFTMGLATVAALLAGGLVAVPTQALAEGQPHQQLPGVMKVIDEAGLFSDEAKKQAEHRMSEAKFDRGLHFSVDTHKTLPAEWKSKFDATTDKRSVFRDWAKSVAIGDKAKGPYVLICYSPAFTEVVVDEES